MRIKVGAVLNIDENVYGTEESEMEWFREMIADKENTMIILHSNDVGDTIGETFDFDWEILNDEQKLPQQEISNGEIEKAAKEYYEENIDNSNIPREHYEWEIQELMAGFCAKWYREQLKNR